MSTATTSQPTAPPPVAHPPSTSSLQVVPLSTIVPSKTNPRKSFEGPEFDELVASIKQHGVLQPVLLRPLDSGWIQGRVSTSPSGVIFELVAGERRFRASKAAGKQAIPAMVQVLSDDQAMEMQVIENMQRKDVTALEEANGFRALHALLLKENPKLTHTELVQTIAQRIGKSVRYVWARLKLNELIPELQKDLIEGRIQPSHADELVRLCAKDQQELRDDHLFDTSMEDVDDEHAVAHSVRQLKEIIAEHYQLELTKPPFPPEDTRLAPGPCSTCLKNSKNSPLADAVGKKVDTCMDRACFAKKREQFVALDVKDVKKVPDFLASKPVLKVTTQHHLTHGRMKGPDALLTRKQWKTAHKGECTNVQPALVFDTDGLHDQAMSAKLICANPKCDVHFGAKPVSKAVAAARREEVKAEAESKKKKTLECERENKIRSAMLQQVVAKITNLSPILASRLSKWLLEQVPHHAEHLDKVLGYSLRKVLNVQSADGLLAPFFAKALALVFVEQHSNLDDWSINYGEGAADGRKGFDQDLKDIGFDPSALRAKAERDLDSAKTPTPEQLASIADPKKAVKSAAKKSTSKVPSSPKAAASPKTKTTKVTKKIVPGGRSSAKKSSAKKGGR